MTTSLILCGSFVGDKSKRFCQRPATSQRGGLKCRRPQLSLPSPRFWGEIKFSNGAFQSDSQIRLTLFLFLLLFLPLSRRSLNPISAFIIMSKFCRDRRRMAEKHKKNLFLPSSAWCLLVWVSGRGERTRKIFKAFHKLLPVRCVGRKRVKKFTNYDWICLLCESRCEIDTVHLWWVEESVWLGIWRQKSVAGLVERESCGGFVTELRFSIFEKLRWGIIRATKN